MRGSMTTAVVVASFGGLLVGFGEARVDNVVGVDEHDAARVNKPLVKTTVRSNQDNFIGFPLIIASI